MLVNRIRKTITMEKGTAALIEAFALSKNKPESRIVEEAVVEYAERHAKDEPASIPEAKAKSKEIAF